LLGRTQVALAQPRSAEQLLDVLEANVEELQRLSRLVTDMLFLAQSDQAQNALNLKLFELSDAATQVGEFLDVIAQERGVSIAVQGKALVTADQGLVQRAITNLLTNAIRHCTPSTQVRVIVQTLDEGVSLEVVNQGSAIAMEHLERIFDRFYRIDSARGRDLGGTGLGLAIVKAIMALHNGTARVHCASPGEVRFSLYFPHPHDRGTK
jgi:two-component system heavy metal sensor histidine kinase CusS